ncbi:hypothetical protein K1719_033410 [Acacia pycnantha]|nr:hypothetical protein K1719_033410 [Acacia pycnantha]
MMEEELQRMKEASQSDPSTAIQAPQRPPRHKKWKAARMKGDKYINEDVVAVASKIDSLEQQSSQGSFTPGTRQDILSTAIGKPDYPDAVRGETRGGNLCRNLLKRKHVVLEIDMNLTVVGNVVGGNKMGHSWMNALRTSEEYENGVEEVILDIRDHLLCDGIHLRYTTWIWHGEEVSTGASHANEVEVDDDDGMEKMINDVEAESFAQSGEYESVRSDAETPLFLGVLSIHG